MLKMKQVAVALITLSAASTVFAADDSGAYILGAVGVSRVSIDKAAFDDTLNSVPVTGLSSTTDERDTGYKLQLGYKLNQNFAIEGGYVDLGKFAYNATFTGGNVNATIKASGWNLVAMGILPLGDTFSLLGRVGMIRAKVEANASTTVPGISPENTSTTNNDFTYGLGVAYNLSKNVSFRADYDRYAKLGDTNSTGGEGDVDLYSLAVAYKF
jgi:OOP family OmpA-OmpF porin